jgi:tetratricopeptide (TPR) repeat protein
VTLLSSALPGNLARRPALWLAIVCALGLALQVAIVSQSRAIDPLAAVPVNDADVYWRWAGDIAGGKLVGATPFLSAPLYPYVVGLVRALGGGLGAVYALQVALHVATAVLLYRIAVRRFSPSTGLIAALLYFLLADPAYYTARVLNCTLQAFVVAALWERALALHDVPRKSTALAVGAWLGLNVLANPTLLVSLPIFALWTWWLAGRGSNGLKLALLLAAASISAIVPATLHNWLACGELIPVSAQAGVTFYHGNAPGADGTYHAIPGISSDRLRQNVDAREMVRAATDGSWQATSKAFFDKGLAYWRADPARALRLTLRKLYWFVSGRNYGDIYVPELEIQDGSASRLILAPLPVAWWTLPALCLLFFSLPKPGRNLPEILLLLVPLATVAVFWYSPRYRFPAIPILCVFGAQVLIEVASPKTERVRRSVLAGSLVLGIVLGFVNRATGFDRAEDYRGQYEHSLGTVLVQQGRLEEALVHYQRALELGELDARASSGDVLRRLGRGAEALELLRDGARRQPDSAYAHKSLAVALAEAQELPAARREFEAALALDPNDWETISGLGNVLLQTGQAEEAVRKYEAALRLSPSYDSARYNLGCALASLNRTAEAEEAFRAAVKINPGLVPAAHKLVEILVARGDHAAAIALLRRTLQFAPADLGLENELAWELATAPAAQQRNGPEARNIAQRLDRDTHGADPGVLDTLAAALAECGRFEDAARTAQECLELARRAALPAEVVRELEARLALYRGGRPYHQAAP